MQIQLLLQEGGEDPTITISSFKLCENVCAGVTDVAGEHQQLWL